jgi:FO synthase/2-phospho-L-lactate guanylyltransferase
VLDPAERERLNRRLLASTLDAIEKWRGDLRNCVVVSPCRVTRDMAGERGAAVVDEGGCAAGLNRAAALGAWYARSNGARYVLILPCDLPYLSTAALAAMSHGAEPPQSMAIASDRKGTGTNALLLSADDPFEVRFGEESFARHVVLAAERGWRSVLCRRPELEFDLDTPEDLARCGPRFRFARSESHRARAPKGRDKQYHRR